MSYYCYKFAPVVDYRQRRINDTLALLVPDVFDVPDVLDQDMGDRQRLSAHFAATNPSTFC
jgi:hypothetical protein